MSMSGARRIAAIVPLLYLPVELARRTHPAECPPSFLFGHDLLLVVRYSQIKSANSHASLPVPPSRVT